MHKNPEKTRLHSDKKADTLDINRRDFLTKSALLGVATGTIGLGLAPTTAFAKDEKLVMTSASNFQPLEVNSPMAKWKKPQSLDFVTGATKRYSFRNWQSGNDDSVYYNMNLPAFFKTRKE